MRKSLTKKERLSAGKAVAGVFLSGQRVSAQGLKLVFIKNGLPFNRAAFSPVRGFGGSVKRNRARRVLKEIYRTNKHLFAPGYDMVLIIYPGDYGYREREKAFLSLCAKAGLSNEIDQ